METVTTISTTPVEIMSCPVVSTRHLSDCERDCGNPDWPVATLENEYGFIVYVGDAKELVEHPEEWPGLLAAAEWAKLHGFSWVRFDADGPKQPGLPIFEQEQ